jgi:hypothetical protein
MITWTKIANKSFFEPVVEMRDKYTGKDNRYTIAAVTKTISRFGPSGSLKNTNIALEQRMEVTPKMSCAVLLDLKCILVIILEIN